MCRVPELVELDLKDVDVVAVDLETYDPDLKKRGSGAVTGKGFVCGIAIATSKQTFYFPIRHARTSNHDPSHTWKILNKKLFQNPNIKKVFHNAMYDVCWIRSETGLMPQGPLLDTMIAASVIDENRMRYSLDAISKDYLKDSKYKYDLQEKSGIKDPLSRMNELSYEVVKDYAEQDVNLTLKLWQKFEDLLQKPYHTNTEGDKKTLKTIFDLETKLFPCLVDMKFKGVRIDVEKANILGNRLEKRKNNLIAIIKKRTGIQVNIWAAASIKKLLQNRKITNYKKTPKSEMPSLPKNYLKTHSDPYLRMIAKARECDKAQHAFVEGLLSYVHNGRIHADINQIRSDQGGTITGRFSMSNPNLQQIPARGYIGKKMRELFIPEENCTWGSFDYSQQEPRIVVHYAVKLNKKGYLFASGIDEVAQSYKDDPKADFHNVVAKLAKIERYQAKTINLGLFYGMGKGKLQKELGISADKAREIFKKYHDTVPFVRKLSKTVQKYAEDNKLLYTLGDRFCRFDRWEQSDKQWNAEKGRFEVVEVINGKEELVQAKAYAEEEAKIKYKATRHDQGEKFLDPECKYFENFWQPAFTYKALNKLVQGGAADMTKTAMVKLYEKGFLPHVSIHDELCFSIKTPAEAETIKDTMEKAIKLEVPNKVDYESGLSWGNIK